MHHTAKRLILALAALSVSWTLAGTSPFKVTKPVLKLFVAASQIGPDKHTYADDCEKKIGIPYVENGDPNIFSKGTLAWFIGPKYDDYEWMESMSPRKYIRSYGGPIFVSTCKRDFVRVQALCLKTDCDAMGRALEFVDIDSNHRKVGHVHNVGNPDLPESQDVNARMAAFMIKHSNTGKQ